MTPRTLSDGLLRDSEVINEGEAVDTAVRLVLDSGLPALPVLDDEGRLVGVFGEREFIQAVFPGYLRELGYAGFVPKTLDEAIERRDSCRAEAVARHMTADHVDVGEDFSDAQVAEIFIHHRVLIVPVLAADGKIIGVITRGDFFRAVAERFLAGPDPSG